MLALLTIAVPGTSLAQEKMVVTFKDGSVQTFETASIARIEFQSVKPPAATGDSAPPASAPPASAPPAAGPCWTGRFGGLDISGYAMDIELTEKDGAVTGGYSYLHKAENKQVTAILVGARVEGDRLKGTWKQVKGIVAEGPFEWKWLPGQKCQAFEGTFSGTKFWHRMVKK